MTAYSNADVITHSLEYLAAHLAVGDTIYSHLKHVSRSGMKREVGLYIPNGKTIVNITGHVACLFGKKLGPHQGIVVHGWGSYAGFTVVYALGRLLYPDGHSCIGRGCPSNDHSNGERNYETHNHRNGGYAFRHEWL